MDFCVQRINLTTEARLISSPAHEHSPCRTQGTPHSCHGIPFAAPGPKPTSGGTAPPVATVRPRLIEGRRYLYCRLPDVARLPSRGLSHCRTSARMPHRFVFVPLVSLRQLTGSW